MEYILGNYHDGIAEIAENQSFPLSYLASDWPEILQWQTIARAKTAAMLNYWPKPSALGASVDKKYERDGLIIEHVSYEQPFGSRTGGLFIYPADISGPLPGVVALHDHGAFKYFGKEKLVELDEEPEILRLFKEESYEGRSWATELAKRGYAVFAPDVFMWGSRRLVLENIPERLVKGLTDHVPGSAEYIQWYNHKTGELETLIAKSLFMAGTTWTGIMAYEDRRALDYFAARPEVDSRRIACGGLSCGGLRAIFLAGLDDRIDCVFVAGFMSTFAEVVRSRIAWHTWMAHVPGLYSLLDMPDILSMHGAKPALCLYNTDDPLWTLAGQNGAHEKLTAIYAKMGSQDKYLGKFYPGPHKMDIAMQEDTFEFLDHWLK